MRDWTLWRVDIIDRTGGLQGGLAVRQAEPGSNLALNVNALVWFCCENSRPSSKQCIPWKSKHDIVRVRLKTIYSC